MCAFTWLNKPIDIHERLLIAIDARFELINFRVDVLDNRLETFCLRSVNDVPIMLELLDVVHECFRDFVLVIFDSIFDNFERHLRHDQLLDRLFRRLDVNFVLKVLAIGICSNLLEDDCQHIREGVLIYLLVTVFVDGLTLTALDLRALGAYELDNVLRYGIWTDTVSMIRTFAVGAGER